MIVHVRSSQGFGQEPLVGGNQRLTGAAHSRPPLTHPKGEEKPAVFPGSETDDAVQEPLDTTAAGVLPGRLRVCLSYSYGELPGKFVIRVPKVGCYACFDYRSGGSRHCGCCSREVRQPCSSCSPFFLGPYPLVSPGLKGQIARLRRRELGRMRSPKEGES